MLRDFDGDGLRDLLVANRDANTVSVYKNRGALSFLDHQILSTGTLPFGAEGFRAGTVEYLAVPTSVSNAVQLYTLGTDGRYDRGATLPSGGSSTRSIIAIDRDSDGDLDLLAVNGSTNDVSLFTFDAGFFGPGTVTPSATPGPRLIEKFDINRDGAPDYAIVSTMEISLFLTGPR